MVVAGWLLYLCLEMHNGGTVPIHPRLAYTHKAEEGELRFKRSLKRSGADPPLCASYACLHTACIANQVPKDSGCLFSHKISFLSKLFSRPFVYGLQGYGMKIDRGSSFINTLAWRDHHVK